MIATELPNTLQGFFDNAWRHAVIEKNPPCYVLKSQIKDLPEEFQKHYENYENWSPVMGPNDIELFSCAYRDGKGNACLIGCSLPEAIYELSFEGLPADDVMNIITGLDPFEGQRAEKWIYDLIDLQTCHDRAMSSALGNPEISYTELIKTNLERFAGVHKLTIPV